MDTQSIEDRLLAWDGACKQIDLNEISITESCDLIAHLMSNYSLFSATNVEGEELSSAVNNEKLRETIFKHKNGDVSLIWENPKTVIKRLQTYFNWDMEGKIFVECVFWPDQLDRDNFNYERFMEFLNPLIHVAGTPDYYVREENESWRFGDIGPDSGVIFYKTGKAN